MAKELPYFKFEPSAWENGNIQMLSREDKGLFLDICSMYWSRLGDLPEKLVLRKLCHGENEAFLNLVEEEIIELKDGQLRVKFLDEQLQEFKDISEKNAANGRKGGRPKGEKNTATEKPKQTQNKPKENPPLSSGYPKEKPNETQTKAIREEEIREEKKREEEIRKKNTRRMSQAKPGDYPDDVFFLVAHGFHQLLLQNEKRLNTKWPHLQKISVEKCRDPIRLMMERDGVTIEELREIGAFLHSETEDAAFWRPNIQSTEGIRKHFAKLLTQARNHGKKASSGRQIHEQLKHFPDYQNM